MDSDLIVNTQDDFPSNQLSNTMDSDLIVNTQDDLPSNQLTASNENLSGM